MQQQTPPELSLPCFAERRYPIAPYGIQSDVRAGMGASYAGK